MTLWIIITTCIILYTIIAILSGVFMAEYLNQKFLRDEVLIEEGYSTERIREWHHFNEAAVVWAAIVWPLTILYFVIFKWIFDFIIFIFNKVILGVRFMAREIVNPKGNV